MDQLVINWKDSERLWEWLHEDLSRFWIYINLVWWYTGMAITRTTETETISTHCCVMEVKNE